MGYATNEACKRHYEGKLTEISHDKKSAERWVEILELQQSNHENVFLRLDIYRMRDNEKAEKKTYYPIDKMTVLGIERGTVETHNNNLSHYVTIFQVSKPPLRFQTDTRTCTKIYEILKGTLDHSSFRVYQHSLNAKQQDLVVHVTSQYISITKVTQLRVQEYWDLRNVCAVSYHNRRVEITIYGTNMPGNATGYKEFTLKNEECASAFATEIGRRLSKVTEKGRNEYTTGPEVRNNFAKSTPSTFPTSRIAEPLQIKDSKLNGCSKFRPSEDTSVNNKTYDRKFDPNVNFCSHRLPPPLPQRKPQPEPRRRVEEPSHPAPPPQRPTPVKDERQNGDLQSPSPKSPPFNRSISAGCGIDSWKTFVSHLGVEEEEIASISVCKDIYPVRNKWQPQIKRSDRASIVPKRPKPQNPDRVKVCNPGGATSQPHSNVSLYPFLFHVWNSEEIIADTLGMNLSTWQDFVVYFELCNTSLTTMNDWKGLAERIGMSPVDIQVIDNYSRRFNQCASAIVMLFWQQNALLLNERYTRPVLLKILRDLEREDLIDVIVKGKG